MENRFTVIIILTSELLNIVVGYKNYKFEISFWTNTGCVTIFFLWRLSIVQIAVDFKKTKHEISRKYMLFLKFKDLMINSSYYCFTRNIVFCLSVQKCYTKNVPECSCLFLRLYFMLQFNEIWLLSVVNIS